MRHSWCIRTDTQHNRLYVWAELRAGRLRQGWGRRPEEDLERIAALRAARAPLDLGQHQTWRGNRRLLESEPDGIGPGDLAVLPHLPRFGTWTVVRIVGPYRYSIDDGRNWMGKPDFGHIVPVEIVSGPIPWRDAAIPPELVAAMRVRIRMWSLDHVGDAVEEVRRIWTPTR
jgi:hypothetical protein